MKLIITNQSSIFSIINNHLNENETKTNKTVLKYITKKVQLLDDDTDDIDISDKDYRKSIFDLFNHLQSSELDYTRETGWPFRDFCV